MANLGSVPGKIPQIRVKVGSPETLFTTNNEPAPGDIQFDSFWYNSLNSEAVPNPSLDFLGKSFEKFHSAACVTLKSFYSAENTRLSESTVYSKYTLSKNRDPNLNEYVDNFYTLYPTQLSSICPYYGGADRVDSYGVTQYGVHNFTPCSVFKYFAKNTSTGALSYYLLPSNSIYSEVVPPRNPQTIRIAQEYTKAWAMGKLSLNSPTTPNPSFYIEIETKDIPKEQSSAFKSTSALFDANTSLIASIQDMEVKKPTFCITIGETRSPINKIEFVFTSGEPSVAVNNGSEECSGPSLTFNSSSKLTLLFRFVPILAGKTFTGGYYEVTSNQFIEPWKVQFKEISEETNPFGILFAEQQVRPVYIGSAPISLSYVGLGVFTFAYGPVRYEQGGLVLFDKDIHRELQYVDYVDIKTTAIYPKAYCTLTSNYADLQDIKGSVHIQGIILVTSSNNYYSPYIFKTSGVIYTKEKDVVSFDEAEEISGVRKITLTPKIENTFLIRTTGSMELTNFVNKWDNIQGLKAITIDFRYMNDEEWERIFTGYMINPNHSRNVYGNKLVTFQLVDRMYILERMRIINSPYFDGTRWISSIKLIFNYLGWRNAEINLGYSFLSNKDYNEYNLPFAPNYLQNPQFRYPFGTDFMTILKEFHKLLRCPMWCGFDGSLRIESPEVFRDQLNSVKYFSDANEAEDDIQHYNIISNPIYNKDTSSLHNIFVVGGPNFDTKTPSDFGIHVITKDFESLYNPEAFNYLGMESIFTLYKIWLCTRRSAQAMAAKLKEISSYPNETVSWSCPYYHTRLMYQPIEFVDTTGVIPSVYEDPITKEEKPLRFYLTGNEFNFDSSRLSASSKLQANIVRGMRLV